MSNAQFIDYIRQFASLARRKHKSYADAVHTLAQERVNTIKAEVTDPKARAAAVQDAQAFLSAEYQPYDHEFAVGSYD